MMNCYRMRSIFQAGIIVVGCSTWATAAGPTVNFDNKDVGPYTSAMMKADFKATWDNGLTEGRGKIVSGGASGSSKALEVKYPAGGFASEKSGVGFKAPLTVGDEMYAEYSVMFKNGFSFLKGGKLPGLCGGACNTGGDKPTGADGFSARFMWRKQGEAVLYLYWMDQPSSNGVDFSLKSGNLHFTAGKWYAIKQYIKLNAPGKADGVIKVWVDGAEVMNKSDFRLRTTTTVKINLFYFSTFFGGNDATWAPPTDQYAYFDNISVSPTGSQAPVVKDPAPSSDGILLDDFEDGNNRSLWNGIWYVFDDSSNAAKSQATLTFEAGKNGAKSSRCAYTLDKGAYLLDPYVGQGNYIKSDKTPADLTGSTGISFWYKGGTLGSVVRIEDVAVAATEKQAYHRYNLEPAKDWKFLSIKWSELYQPPWAGVTPTALDLKKIVKLTWQIKGDRTATAPVSGDLWLDDIRIVGLKTAPFSPPVSLDLRKTELARHGNMALTGAKPGIFTFGDTRFLRSMDGRLLRIRAHTLAP